MHLRYLSNPHLNITLPSSIYCSTWQSLLVYIICVMSIYLSIYLEYLSCNNHLSKHWHIFIDLPIPLSRQTCLTKHINSIYLFISFIYFCLSYQRYLYLTILLNYKALHLQWKMYLYIFFCPAFTFNKILNTREVMFVKIEFRSFT